MTPLAATASAAPLLLSLLGTAVLMCFVLRTALSQERKLWKALRGLAPRAAALLGVALLVLFVQIGGSLNKNAPERDGFAPLLDNANSEQLAGENRDSSASAIPVDTLYITGVAPLTNSVYRLTLQWDSCAYYPAHTLDVWATTNLLAGPWAIACSTNIWDISFETNRVDVIVTNAADTAFFRLASPRAKTRTETASRTRRRRLSTEPTPNGRTRTRTGSNDGGWK